MKKLRLIAMLLGACLTANAQQKQPLTAQATSCAATGTACVVQSVDPQNGGATFTLSGTFSATVQFEASGDGGSTWVSLNVTPSNSTTAVTSATGSGTWQANVAGYTNIRERVSTFSSGTVIASINFSLASARAGGGGNGASGTTTNQTAKGISYNSSGTATAVDASIAAPTTNGQYTCGYTVTASAAVAPTCPQVGLAPDQAAGATVLYSDNNNVIYNPAAALSLPTPTTLANANFFTVIKTPGGTASTLTPVTWTVSLNGATAGASAVLPAYNSCSVNVDQVASTQWDVNCSLIGLTGTGVSTVALTTPATPTITPTCGSACGSTYVYNIVAKDIYGNRTLRSTSGTTAAQNATLSGTNYNTITWTPVTGAYSYDVYIITGGNAPGLIANVLATAPLSVKDTGLTVCYADTPLSNDTNQMNFSGNSLAADISINGVLAGAGPGTCTGQNTRFGGAALGVNTSGYLNSAFGYEALQTNTTGYYNSAFGWEALEQNTSGHDNVAIGVSALANNLTGSYNMAMGSNALLHSTGDGSTAIGTSACNSLTAGQCIGIGGGAFQTVTTGTNNTGIGEDAGQYNTGSYSTVLGQQALQGVNGTSTGGYNTAIGDAALVAVTSGTNNTAVGFDTAASVTTDTYSTYVGDEAHASAATGVTNETVLGEGATGAGSNTAVIGNSSVTDVYLGSTTPAAAAHATKYISTVTTGTAPLTVASTTPVANLTVSNHPQVQFCGTTTTCSHTAETGGKIVFGSAALVSGSPSTAAVTGISPAFTATGDYVCTVSGQSGAATDLLSVVNVSASAFTITGPATDTRVVNYICVGF